MNKKIVILMFAFLILPSFVSAACNETRIESALNSSYTTIDVTQVCDPAPNIVASAIILLPLIIGGFFLFVSKSLDEEDHAVLKMSLFGIGLFTIFQSIKFALMAVIQYLSWPEMIDAVMFASEIYTWVMWLLIAYFIIHAGRVIFSNKKLAEGTM